ncbi:capsular biosynthesis protein [Bacillus sp. AGMB 02131]|uniref:Capsular biosynthesis protein n=1 Tax=Peribacillus faecalis TaxID=2772559 RepID=A0A927CYK2_9BACI|nr:capsular biosynthesis protein [Peribacillus faecalis]MBD3107699.1 capsular biosynthesis protein [Peribacillus faecalis]
MRNKETVKEISIKEIIQPLLRYSWLIILTVLIFGLGGYYIAQSNKGVPLYQSSAKIIVNATAENMSTMQVIIKDTVVLEKVVSELKLSMSPEQLANSLEVYSVGSSYVVIISATNKDSQLAADIANTTARVFKETVPTILDFDAIHYLSEAKATAIPIATESSNSTILKVSIIGLVLAIGLAYLLNVFDSRIRTIQEVEEQIGLPVIGYISKSNKKNTRNNNKKKDEKMLLVSKETESNEVKI